MTQGKQKKENCLLDSLHIHSGQYVHSSSLNHLTMCLIEETFAGLDFRRLNVSLFVSVIFSKMREECIQTM